MQCGNGSLAGRRLEEPPTGSRVQQTTTPNLDDRLTALVDGEPVAEWSPAFPEGRRRARALAVQALYEAELTGRPGRAALGRIAGEDGLSGQLMQFASNMVERVESDRLALDRLILDKAAGFPADQMAAIDRCVLRVALAEREVNEKASTAVVINEAVEVAKLFGSESSGKFVNGVAGALLG